MLIAVTGGTGRLGSAVVQELLQHGHDVRPIDVRPGKEPSLGPDALIANLANMHEARSALDGVDAICHLGNYPGFPDERASEGFSNNVNSTFNVFQVAAEKAIRRVIFASSIQAYGCVRNYGYERLIPPQYLPIDEAHPLLAANPYGLSKSVGESIADAFSRRLPDLCAFSLRFTQILSGYFSRKQYDTHHWSIQGAMDTFVQRDDAVRAVRLCCESDRPGHLPLNIVAPQSARPWSQEEITSAFGACPPSAHHLDPEHSLIRGDLARETIGFQATMPICDPAKPIFQNS